MIASSDVKRNDHRCGSKKLTLLYIYSIYMFGAIYSKWYSCYCCCCCCFCCCYCMLYIFVFFHFWSLFFISLSVFLLLLLLLLFFFSSFSIQFCVCVCDAIDNNNGVVLNEHIYESWFGFDIVLVRYIDKMMLSMCLCHRYKNIHNTIVKKFNFELQSLLYIIPCIILFF